MRVPGEDLNGVYSANEYLTRINLMKAYKPGCAYSDNARQARRDNRRGAMWPWMRRGVRCAWAHKAISCTGADLRKCCAAREIHHAREEGVEFMKPGRAAGGAGRREGLGQRPGRRYAASWASRTHRGVAVRSSCGHRVRWDVDMVIVCDRHEPQSADSFHPTPGLETNRKGCLIVREDSLRTSREAVWAGGDAVTGAATVILAMGAGKQAARRDRRVS